MRSGTMRAIVFDGAVRFVSDYPAPGVRPGWALIRVTRSGLCNTDLEITKGYMAFRGILGHEFVGVVEECDDRSWLGRRVVGEINAGCGKCRWCQNGLARHCPDRSVLGILKHDGCMADYCTLPTRNLREVPAGMSDDRAVFVEPLSAACEILEQLGIGLRAKDADRRLLDGQCTAPAEHARVLVLGDGKLGVLCAWVLSTVFADVTLVGHHPEKLAAAQWGRLRTTLESQMALAGADLVVEATGSGSALARAIELCRPRGTIVLKTTVAASEPVNLSPVVIGEQRIIGSRCGQFDDGLALLQAYPDMPIERLITARFRMEQAPSAFEEARKPSSLKVLLEM